MFLKAALKPDKAKAAYKCAQNRTCQQIGWIMNADGKTDIAKRRAQKEHGYAQQGLVCGEQHRNDECGA